MHYRTIIISDVHVGTPDSQYEKLYAFLQEHTCDTLILNGDIIDEQHVFLFKRFKQRKKEYTDFLTYLVDKTNHRSTVFYLNGNHDTFRGGSLFPQNGKVILCEDLIYPSGEHTYYICHGQQLDRVKRNIAFLTPLSLLVSAVFYWINRQYNKLRLRLHLPYQSILGKLKQIGKFVMV
ncbi:MAG: metallophosphoesterase [bacterium]